MGFGFVWDLLLFAHFCAIAREKADNFNAILSFAFFFPLRETSETSARVCINSSWWPIFPLISISSPVACALCLLRKKRKQQRSDLRWNFSSTESLKCFFGGIPFIFKRAIRLWNHLWGIFYLNSFVRHFASAKINIRKTIKTFWSLFSSTLLTVVFRLMLQKDSFELELKPCKPFFTFVKYKIVKNLCRITAQMMN